MTTNEQSNVTNPEDSPREQTVTVEKPSIITFDGEGIGQEKDDGTVEPHRYVLLAAGDSKPRGQSKVCRFIEVRSDGLSYDHEGKRLNRLPARYDVKGFYKGLRTSECLNFLLSLPSSATCVGFSTGYDLSMMLRDLKPEELYMLTHEEKRPSKSKKSSTPESIKWIDPEYKDPDPYLINLQGRKFTIKRNKKTVVLWDVFSFFQTSFVKALKNWNIGEKLIVERIEAMKKKRDDFSNDTREEVIDYCLTECRYNSQMVELLIESHDNAGLSLKAYHGAGSSADAMLRAIGIREALGRSKKGFPPRIDKYEDKIVESYEAKGYHFKPKPFPKNHIIAVTQDVKPMNDVRTLKPKGYWTKKILEIGASIKDVTVSDAQRILGILITGLLDQPTANAIGSFQQRAGLRVSGQLEDGETSSALLFISEMYQTMSGFDEYTRIKEKFNDDIDRARNTYNLQKTDFQEKSEVEKSLRARVKGPDDMQSAVYSAFFGGRFEHSVMGIVRATEGTPSAAPDSNGLPGVWGYDISSAYPCACLSLPCLLHSTWRLTHDEEEFRENPEHALVHYALSNPPAGIQWGPLPYRTENGSVVYAAKSGGGWVWSGEFREAQKAFNKFKRNYVQFIEAWIYKSDCDCQPPFTRGGANDKGLAGYYLERIKFGKEGKGLTIKGAINSCYGKTAQSRGKDPIYQSFIWSGMITSGCRARVLELMGAHRDINSVLAIATDGLYTLEYFSDDRLPPPPETGTGEKNLPPAVRWAIQGRNAKIKADYEAKPKQCGCGQAMPLVLESMNKPLGGWERKQVGCHHKPKDLFLLKPGIYFPTNPSEKELEEAVRARGLGRVRLGPDDRKPERGGTGKTGVQILVDTWLNAKQDDLRDPDTNDWVKATLPPRKRFHGMRASVHTTPCKAGEPGSIVHERWLKFDRVPPKTKGAKPLPELSATSLITRAIKEDGKSWGLHDGNKFLLVESNALDSEAINLPVMMKYIMSDDYCEWKPDTHVETFSPFPKRGAIRRKGLSATLDTRRCDSGLDIDEELIPISTPYEPHSEKQMSEEKIRALAAKQFWLDAKDSGLEDYNPNDCDEIFPLDTE